MEVIFSSRFTLVWGSVSSLCFVVTTYVVCQFIAMRCSNRSRKDALMLNVYTCSVRCLAS